jgi:excisionase family DNA binding protein
MQMDATTTLLTVPQAAALVGVHRATVYRAIRRGDLHADRFGRSGAYRIAREAVDTWLGRDQTTTDMSGVLSRTEVVRLLVESDGSRRDIETSPLASRVTRSPRGFENRRRTAQVGDGDAGKAPHVQAVGRPRGPPSERLVCLARKRRPTAL